MRTRGIYEQIVTDAVARELDGLPSDLVAFCWPSDTGDGAARAELADMPDRVAMHVAAVLRRVLEDVPDKDRPAVSVELANRLLAAISSPTREVSWVGEEVLVDPIKVLTEVAKRNPDGKPARIDRPIVSLLDSVLLTNWRREPRIAHQVHAEIASADRIDILMAFIVRGGLRPLLAALRDHITAGGAVRVLTTTFTGTTEVEALMQLQKIGADIRVSYDRESTRLHAKAWIFHRAGGFHTAYVGSSNLSGAGTVSGREWNVRVSGARNPQIVARMRQVFEAYWADGDFQAFDADRFREMRASQQTQSNDGFAGLSPIEVRLDPFQERMLEQIAVARTQGHHRNLLVSATGTGKTVMSAEDYRRLRVSLPSARLLFVAHRIEILEKSRATFRHVLRDPTFGELWVGGARPTRFEHVFASIQSLGASGLQHLAADHFDVVIVDEFHHAAAATYTRLLSHIEPVELLGLTATPERADGESVLGFFDGRIAAELRLWDAIEQERLCPFEYYGVSDGVDLRDVPWQRGRGYDATALSNLLTADHAYARQILDAVVKSVGDLSTTRCLGFCASVAHARFMADQFVASGVSARAVWADTTPELRARALRDLADGRLNVLFAVDLFNEGLDIPQLDTILFLRPTDSPTIFLQQLGRGLRRSPSKDRCLVLDFVSQHRAEFRLEQRFEALLGVRNKQLQQQVEQGFPYLPAGCHIELDVVARERVLASIRRRVTATGAKLVAELARCAQDTADVNLSAFLADMGLQLEDIYERGRGSWSSLREAAGLPCLESGSLETAFRAACGRLLHVDDSLRLLSWTRWLGADAPPDPGSLSTSNRAVLRMLLTTMYAGSKAKIGLNAALVQLWRHPQVLAELRELLPLLAERVGHVTSPLLTPPDVPLLVHGQYTRHEILAAFGVGEGPNTAEWREGVRKIDAHRCDLLLVTHDKSNGAYSPSTQYRDYAIARDLFHWQSQSTTSDTSETGQRYIKHVEVGWSILLFARQTPDSRAFVFLGPATYLAHEPGRPMSITWRLAHPLPGDIYAEMAAAVA